jgi:DNA-binding beta-propeller fold protein YncE
MKTVLLGLCALATAGSPMAVEAQPSAVYRQVATVPLGSPERWDYVVSDEPSGRVYVAHGDRLTVIDGRSLQTIGEVGGLKGGAHGTYISHATGLGFTDDGEAGKAVAFDPTTLQVRATLDAAPDADAIAGEGATVYVVDGDSGVITVVDAHGPVVRTTIKVGGSLESAVVDGAGRLFVNGADRGEVVRIDTATNAITARWSVADCKRPHGMAIDPARHRLFTSCVNGRLDVLDTETGREVASAPIGLGTDSAAFDPVRHRVFSSNGRDGTISVIQEVDADTYRPLEPVKTAIGARTMAVDVKTGRLFVASADIDPAGPATGRRKFLPGTLKLLVFDPAP